MPSEQLERRDQNGLCWLEVGFWAELNGSNQQDTTSAQMTPQTNPEDLAFNGFDGGGLNPWVPREQLACPHDTLCEHQAGKKGPSPFVSGCCQCLLQEFLRIRVPQDHVNFVGATSEECQAPEPWASTRKVVKLSPSTARSEQWRQSQIMWGWRLRTC